MWIAGNHEGLDWPSPQSQTRFVATAVESAGRTTPFILTCRALTHGGFKKTVGGVRNRLTGSVVTTLLESATCTVKLSVPNTPTGVPLMTPLPLKLSPGGKLLLTMLQTYGGAPPVAVNERL